jgi:hypothetical protein
MIDIRGNIIACCICDTEISEWESNNAMPLKDEGCCDDCNFRYVVPARLGRLKEVKKQLKNNENNLQD